MSKSKACPSLLRILSRLGACHERYSYKRYGTDLRAAYQAASSEKLLWVAKQVPALHRMIKKAIGRKGTVTGWCNCATCRFRRITDRRGLDLRKVIPYGVVRRELLKHYRALEKDESL